MSYRPRGHLFAAILTAGFGGAALAGSAQAQTLADSIAQAYQSNPTLKAQQATQRALDESYVQARTGWRPTLNAAATANYSRTDTPRAARGAPVDRNGDGIPDVVGGQVETNNSTLRFTFNQPLWTGGRTAAAVSAAQADVFAGQENLRRTESQILLLVIQAYADVRRDQEAVRIQTNNLTVLQRQLEESRARFEVGEITRTDVAQSEARMALAQAQLRSGQAQLEVSRANYTAAVGQPPASLAPEPSLAFLLPANADEAATVAEGNNPALRAQQFAEQASRARAAGARSERMPQLSAQAALGYNGPFLPEPPLDALQRDLYARNVTGTVNLTVPLFAGGGVSSRIRQAVERNNADKLTIDAQRRTVLQNVTQFWNQLMAARGNIASSAQQVAAARIAAEGVRREQEVGLRTTIDVLNAEQELRSAELQQVNARRDEYVAAANILSSMGRLEAKNLTPAVGQYDPKANFRRLRFTWGWVPWEEPISRLDQALAGAGAAEPSERAAEAPIGTGLSQSAPAHPPLAPSTSPNDPAERP